MNELPSLNPAGYSRSDQLEYETIIARGESGGYYEYFDEGYKYGYAFYILQHFYTALAAIAAVYGGLSYNSYGKETSVDDLVSDTTK